MASKEDKTYEIHETNSYPFVPSTAEHNRLEAQCAALNSVMHNTPSHAPLSSPTKILDIGCGTGMQTDLLARKYPNATVIGIDMSPVPDLRPKASNITYILGDFNELMGKHELLKEGTFDLVYQRMLLMAVKDWPKHLKTCTSLLKPGGYLETQEMDVASYWDRNEKLISPDWHWLDVFLRYPTDSGFDLHICPKLKKLFQDEMGLEDVQVGKYPVPGREGWEERPEAQSLGKYMNWASPAMHEFLIKKGAKEGEDAEELFGKCKGDYFEGEVGVHCGFWAVVGRKK